MYKLMQGKQAILKKTERGRKEWRKGGENLKVYDLIVDLNQIYQ